MDGHLWREIDQPEEMFLGTYANGPRNDGSIRRHLRQSHTDCSEIDKELSAKEKYEKTTKTDDGQPDWEAGQFPEPATTKILPL